jgi:hypothetical protein
MRANPLVLEVLAGISRQGRAQLDYLALLGVQALVALMWWPKGSVGQILETQSGPTTLTAVVIAVGATTAYHALRAGAEEFLLPGQHGLRDWALATPLSLSRIVGGYVLGHVVYVLYLLVLSSPVLLMAFTVSGGEWQPLALCLAATLVQAMFYALTGALMRLTLGHHPEECHFFVRALLVVVYVLIGWLAPVTSHIAFTARALGDGVQATTAVSGVPDPWVFMALYAGASMALALAVSLLLMRSRARRAGARSAAVTP